MRCTTHAIEYLRAFLSSSTIDNTKVIFLVVPLCVEWYPGTFCWQLVIFWRWNSCFLFLVLSSQFSVFSFLFRVQIFPLSGFGCRDGFMLWALTFRLLLFTPGPSPINPVNFVNPINYLTINQLAPFHPPCCWKTLNQLALPTQPYGFTLIFSHQQTK